VIPRRAELSPQAPARRESDGVVLAGHFAGQVTETGRPMLLPDDRHRLLQVVGVAVPDSNRASRHR
jgi:hypothetical protein